MSTFTRTTEAQRRVLDRLRSASTTLVASTKTLKAFSVGGPIKRPSGAFIAQERAARSISECRLVITTTLDAALREWPATEENNPFWAEVTKIVPQ